MIFLPTDPTLMALQPSTRDFLRSPEFRNQVLISIGISFFLLVIVFFSLRWITQHNVSAPVPDLQGKTLEDAISLIKDQGLDYEVIDSVYVSSVPRGSVFDQIPPAGRQVKDGRKILLTINAFGQEKVPMPYLIGISLRQAQALLTQAGLTAGEFRYVPDIAVNNVLRQEYLGNEIRAGVLIPRNARIDLVLGQGLSNEKTLVPYLIGLRLQEARELVYARSLNLGAVIFDSEILSSEDSSTARIWKQIPSRHRTEQLFLGSPVDIWLSLDEEKIDLDSALVAERDSILPASQ